jgi:hypothetical protein
MQAAIAEARPGVPDLEEFERLAAEHNLFFYYRGYFSQLIVEASAEAIRSRLAGCDANFQTQRKMISTFIEMGQNIIHYSADVLTAPSQDVDEVRFGVISIRAIDGEYELRCSNPVDATTAERLESKLAPLTRMSLDEIKQSYRAALKAEGDAESKGGGIGLLTLARDSRAPLEYAFSPIADRTDLVTFHLTVRL